MKYLGLTIIFILWVVTTIIFTVTIIGIFVMILMEETWFDIPGDIISKFK